MPVICPLFKDKAQKSEEKRQKRGDSRQKSEEKRQKAKKKGRFPPAPSTPTPLRTSQVGVTGKFLICSVPHGRLRWSCSQRKERSALLWTSTSPAAWSLAPSTASTRTTLEVLSEVSGISKPVVWGTRGLHPGFPWFSRHFCGFRDLQLSSLFVAV